MPITFACACGRRLTVPDSLALKQARCPACDQVVNVPSASVAFAEPPPLPMASPAAEPTFRPGAPPGPGGWSSGDMAGSAPLPQDPQATTIFVLGLISIVGSCFPLGLIAFFMGNAHRTRVSHGQCRSNGLATAGWAMGMISTILTVLGLLFFFGVLGLGIFGAAVH